MAGIYSIQIASGELAAPGNVTLYTVPSGVTVVVRCVILMPNTTGANSSVLYVPGKGPIAGSNGGVANVSETFNLRAVLNPGDVVDFANVSGNWGYFVSGYYLV